ncbi:MAG TPA: alanine racemase [Clostridia bacterium]
MAHCIINLDAIRHNFQVVKSNIKSKICAVIKADAYGHGLVQTARALKDADCFGVARACEALALREANIKNDILLMGGFEDDYILKELIKNNVILSIHSEEELNILSSAVKDYSNKIRIHIKVDSGMRRLGVTDQKSLKNILKKIYESKNIQIESVYTHYATSDWDVSFLEEQYNNFLNLTADLKYPKHSANSAAIFQDKKYHMDMVRAGIILYGYINNPELTAFDGNKVRGLIKPAMSIYADILQIKTLEAGEYIGYDKGYQAKRPSKIAIISIGYGDGYPRLVNKGYVIIKNKKCKILGKVCMDLTAVDITDVPNVSYQDKAEILGKNIGADVVARWNKTISYDILCSGTKRIKKTWIGLDGET